VSTVFELFEVFLISTTLIDVQMDSEFFDSDSDNENVEN